MDAFRERPVITLITCEQDDKQRFLDIVVRHQDCHQH